ncbi:MAG: 16S rRNA (adenine(1518)-N(6)/adenine(1519)-N(6))-dimethyltransferase RsmA [Candidatus Bathyarchaeia archaeon]
MSLLEKTKQILGIHGILPKKSLGQNFLVDKEVLFKMVSYAAPSKKDVILDIGAGLGFLTQLLAEKAKQVIAVEIDSRLIGILKERLCPYGNVTLLQGDIMKIPIPFFDKVVSTPPYFISSSLLFWLFNRDFECAVLTLQEDFVRRLIASPGSDDYGRLSVAASYSVNVELLDEVSREMFWPTPKINSRIICLRPKKTSFFIEDKRVFHEVVQVLFTQKNKKIRNAIMPFFNKLDIPKDKALELADDLPFYYKRPRDLMPEEFRLIANEVVKKLRNFGLH